MSQEKYIGMDVHQATISVAVTDSQGKLILRDAAVQRRWYRYREWPSFGRVT